MITFMMFYLLFHLMSSYVIFTTTDPHKLNKLLERTAMSILFFGLQASLLLVL